MRTAPRPPRLATPLLAALLCLVWSSAFVFIEIGLRDTTAAPFAALRAVTAVPALAVGLVVVDASGLRAALTDRRVHLVGALLGLVNVAGFLGLQTAGFELSGIGFGAVLIYTQPLLVAALARLVLAERLRPVQVLGLLAGWAGVGLAVLGETTGKGAAAGSGADVWWAAGLFLGAAACFAVGTVVVKAVTVGPRAVPLGPALMLALVYGSLPLVVLAVVAGGPVRWTGTLAVSVAYTGAVSLAGGYLLQFRLLERGDAGVVSSWIFAVPVLAAAYGVVVFGEVLSAGLVAGGAAVAVGILLVSLPARPRPLEEVP